MPPSHSPPGAPSSPTKRSASLVAWSGAMSRPTTSSTVLSAATIWASAARPGGHAQRGHGEQRDGVEVGAATAKKPAMCSPTRPLRDRARRAKPDRDRGCTSSEHEPRVGPPVVPDQDGPGVVETPAGTARATRPPGGEAAARPTLPPRFGAPISKRSTRASKVEVVAGQSPEAEHPGQKEDVAALPRSACEPAGSYVKPAEPDGPRPSRLMLRHGPAAPRDDEAENAMTTRTLLCSLPQLDDRCATSRASIRTPLSSVS